MGLPPGGAEPPTIVRRGATLAGRYILSRPLQSGGMAVVWEATDAETGAAVAVKLLHASQSGTQGNERMLREARALARIRHRAAARVLDFQLTHDGVALLVLELLEGRTLLELIEERWRLEARDAVALLLPVLGALADAHDQGVVHRDVKPGNVVLAERPGAPIDPKLIDFGLALLGDGEARITQDGALIGTPAYVAPEQAQGRGEADLRADLWSFSVVLYHAVTGRVPFEGRGALEVLDAIRHREPTPITELRAGDPLLWSIIERGLRKQPGERWSSARALGSRLARWLVDHGVDADVSGVPLREEWEPRAFVP